MSPHALNGCRHSSVRSCILEVSAFFGMEVSAFFGMAKTATPFLVSPLPIAYRVPFWDLMFNSIVRLLYQTILNLASSTTLNLLILFFIVMIDLIIESFIKPMALVLFYKYWWFTTDFSTSCGWLRAHLLKSVWKRRVRKGFYTWG